jgi:hypothetical protein
VVAGGKEPRRASAAHPVARGTFNANVFVMGFTCVVVVPGHLAPGGSTEPVLALAFQPAQGGDAGAGLFLLHEAFAY